MDVELNTNINIGPRRVRAGLTERSQRVPRGARRGTPAAGPPPERGSVRLRETARRQG